MNNTNFRFDRLRKSLTATGLACASLLVAPPANSSVFDFNTDSLTLNGASSGSLYGTSFSARIEQAGVAQFLFSGDLNFLPGDTVNITGSRALSLYAGNNAFINQATFNGLSANGANAGSGGGTGGAGANNASTGLGGESTFNLNYGNGGQGAIFLVSPAQNGTAGGSGHAGMPGNNGSGGSNGAAGLNNSASSGGSAGSGANYYAPGGGGGAFGRAGIAGNGGRGGTGGLGNPGAIGGSGGDGQSGMNSTTGLTLSGGSGGSGGGQGGGGSSGGQGGGGGGGGGADLSFVFTGGNGGYGGNGGAGGYGGHGGDGGSGGGGAGAIEIRAKGQVTVAGSFTAAGGNGSRGGDGLFGAAGNSGGNGQAGGVYVGFQGGSGGDGGHGGYGAPGGNGGNGAGGAGGTIMLNASVVRHNGLTVNVLGGSGGGGGGLPPTYPAPAGSNGRLVIGSNAPFDFGTVGFVGGGGHGGGTPASAEFYAGRTGVNPYITGAPNTPYVPNLVGGAEVYGLLSLTSQSDEVTPLLGTPPAGAVAELLRLSIGPGGYAQPFSGYDMLLYVNLSARALSNPSLGIDPQGNASDWLVPLSQGGLAHDPVFGGDASPSLLDVLGGHRIYATLIPRNGTIFNVGFNGLRYAGLHLNGDGARVFLPVPEPEKWTMLVLGILLVAGCGHRRSLELGYGSLPCDNSPRSRIRSPSLSSAWARCAGVVRAWMATASSAEARRSATAWARRAGSAGISKRAA